MTDTIHSCSAFCTRPGCVAGREQAEALDAEMVRNHIRARMEAMRVTQAQYAEMCGYSPQYLSDFLNGKRSPGRAILDAEGLEAVTHYEYKRSP